jgi:murein L,D-transpeptidase YafK
MHYRHHCTLQRMTRAILMLVPCLLLSLLVQAQAKSTTDGQNLPRTNYKVVEEHKDKDGNIIRTVQYDKGRNRITETQLIKIMPNLHLPINPDTLNHDSLLIVVHKSHYVVEVYYRRRMIRSYKAVFGPKPLEDKKMEGDRCTPEGWFTIVTRNPRSKYNKFMLLSYPNDSAIHRLSDLKAKGLVPRTARIGGDVGIHGVWPGGDDMIEKGVPWTDGCIAIKNKDMDELYSFAATGTRVFIKR